jgi:hypothetical protein
MKESVRSHLIEIYVDPRTGNFTYKPAVYHAKAGKETPVSWYANGDWAVQFTSGTPLETLGIRGHAEKVVDTKVRSDAPRGVYHYAVAVTIDHDVFLDAGCPTIVID